MYQKQLNMHNFRCSCLNCSFSIYLFCDCVIVYFILQTYYVFKSVGIGALEYKREHLFLLVNGILLILLCNFLIKNIFSSLIWCLLNTEILNFKIFWQKVFIIIVILYSWNNFHDFMCFFYNLFCLENSLRILYKVEFWYLFIFFGMIETVSISLQCWPKIPTIWGVVFPIKYKNMNVKSIEKDLPNSR